MWIMLNDAFYSIVAKDGPGTLTVRARRHGDIEKTWPRADVVETHDSDYQFRAILPVPAVVSAISQKLLTIDYDNFKSSVVDDNLHRAYLSVWTAMATLQENTYEDTDT